MLKAKVSGRIHKTSLSSYLTNGPNKLEFYVTLGWKGFPGIIKLIGLIHFEVIEVL